MLERIQGLPANVAGVRASGEVTADDLKNVLLPALDQLSKQYGKIRYLLQLDNDVQNWDFGAWLQDAKAGIKHFAEWERIAVVTDQKAVERFTDIFSALVPGKAKGFTHGELEEAKEWVGEGS